MKSIQRRLTSQKRGSTTTELPSVCSFSWFFNVQSRIYRIKLASVVKLIQVLITSATILLIFQRLGDDERSIQNRNGVLFFIVLNTVFNGFQSVLLLFPDE